MNENTAIFASPFEGTPWNSDEEIYNYASNKKYNLGWGWNDVKNDLINHGLEEGYADAIIQNLIQTYGHTGPGSSEYFETSVIDNRGMFRRPFSFKGRIRRTEYGLSLLLYYAVIYGGTFLIVSLSGIMGMGSTEILFYLLLIACLWFLWAQGAKRCHDLGNSGWFQLIPFYILWLLFAPGDQETTGYGNSPKA